MPCQAAGSAGRNPQQAHAGSSAAGSLHFSCACNARGWIPPALQSTGPLLHRGSEATSGAEHIKANTTREHCQAARPGSAISPAPGLCPCYGHADLSPQGWSWLSRNTGAEWCAQRLVPKAEAFGICRVCAGPPHRLGNILSPGASILCPVQLGPIRSARRAVSHHRFYPPR